MNTWTKIIYSEFMIVSNLKISFNLISLCILTVNQNLWSQIPKEKEGFIRVEAEAFASQEMDEVRRWYRVDAEHAGWQINQEIKYRLDSASAMSFIEILPDTRQTHEDTLKSGENFSNQPGQMGIINYPVEFENPGRYFVWVRAFSTGSEDNGLHVGINGEWPESGQRMQWCEGKNQWTWASKQRTISEHCGVERLIYLDVDYAGLHTISFSMREDGFRFDAWAMSKDYIIPD